MRVGKLDKIILVNTPIYERQTEDSARWFYKDKYNRASPLQELGRRETGSSSDQPRDDYEGWSLQISQESSQHQNLADTLRNDQIYLDGNRVRY
ncbi:hypothetical protein DFQ29_008026 [Apophysomyces sp. BC1021]|nr:hypothetical protein DFQ29_008026 [Apophysomyces sp. BC1021]